MSDKPATKPHLTERQYSLHLEQQALPRVFYATGMAIILGFILWIGKSILIPLVIAIFLAFLIVTLKNSITKLPGFGKYIPNWLSFALAFVVIAVLLIGLGDIIVRNTAQIIESAPQYTQRLSTTFKSFSTYIQEIAWLPDNVKEPFRGGLDDVTNRIITIIPAALRSVGGSVSSFAANLITVLLYTIFMLIERGRIIRKLGILGNGNHLSHPDATDVHNNDTVRDVLADIGNLVRQYISIKTMMALIVSSISFVIMTLLNIDFAGFWALLIFALNFVPIIGSAIGISLPVLLALVQPEGGGVQLAIMALILLLGVEQIASSFIEPRLMGKSLNLSPLVILLSLSIWGTLWGFAGMLLCVPITVAVMIILSQFHTSRPVAIMLSDNGEISEIKRFATKPAENTTPENTPPEKAEETTSEA